MESERDESAPHRTVSGSMGDLAYLVHRVPLLLELRDEGLTLTVLHQSHAGRPLVGLLLLHRLDVLVLVRDLLLDLREVGRDRAEVRLLQPIDALLLPNNKKKTRERGRAHAPREPPRTAALHGRPTAADGRERPAGATAPARTSRLGTARMFSTAFDVTKFFDSFLDAFSVLARSFSSSLLGSEGRMRSEYANAPACNEAHERE